METILPELWKAAQQAGPFAALWAIYAWWGERAERIKLQAQVTELTKETALGLTKTADSMEDLVDFLKSGRKKGV